MPATHVDSKTTINMLPRRGPVVYATLGMSPGSRAMTSRVVDSRLPVWSPMLRFVATLLVTLLFPLPVDRTEAATIAGSFARRAIIGLYQPKTL